jgi:hypothetical protein
MYKACFLEGERSVQEFEVGVFWLFARASEECPHFSCGYPSWFGISSRTIFSEFARLPVGHAAATARGLGAPPRA